MKYDQTMIPPKGFYMEEIVVYVHGKGGSAQEAEHYKALFPDCEVIGFDYHAQSPWEAVEEFPGFFCGSSETLQEAHTGGK